MLRALAFLGVLIVGCGDLEADRLCARGPCATGPSSDCLRYIRCFETTGGTRGVLDSTYGKGGVCWTSVAASDSCTAACKSSVDQLLLQFPDAGC